MANPQYTPEELLNEIWKAVVGYETIYSVSSLGRVRRDAAAPGTHIGRIVAPSPDVDGYQRVCLSAHNKRKHYKVHRLVMAAFVGPRPTGLEINHKDGDKFNPRLDNLEYITSQENREHASRLGLVATGSRHGSVTKPHCVLRGEATFKAKLTTDTVRLIRRRYEQDQSSQPALAKEYGVSKTAIRYIIIRKNWKHV